MIIAQTWQGIQKHTGYTMFSGERTTGPTWPKMYTSLLSIATPVDVTDSQRSTKDGYSCFHPVEHWNLSLSTSRDHKKTKQGNRFIIVMADRNSKLTWAVPKPKITAPHVAIVVLRNWYRMVFLILFLRTMVHSHSLHQNSSPRYVQRSERSLLHIRNTTQRPTVKWKGATRRW